MARRSLYLIRHAIAAERGEEWPDDTKRPLTHEGAAKMRVVVSGIEALGVEIGLVLTSPLVRAVQTAEIVTRGLESHPEVVEFPTLAPGHTPAKVAEALSTMHRPPKELALVGHEPDLGALGAWLLGGRSPLAFKKGGVARIDIATWPPTRDGHLAWFATPKMLRALGKD